jgi:hypothetical protein
MGVRGMLICLKKTHIGIIRMEKRKKERIERERILRMKKKKRKHMIILLELTLYMKYD